MGFEGLKDGLALPRQAIKLPGQVVERVSDYAVGVVTDTFELIAPTKTTEEFVDSLIQQRPISEQECAFRALKAAERTRKAARSGVVASLHITEDAVTELKKRFQEADTLANIGFAMLKKNIIRAEESDEIPDDTTQQLVIAAIEVGADPEKRGFLQHEEVATTAEIFDKHDNITIFPSAK